MSVFGYFIEDLFLTCVPNDKAIVIGPKRPINIKLIITSFETVPKEEVIPVERPTVPIADTVSNNKSMQAISSILVRMMIPPTIQNK